MTQQPSLFRKKPVTVQAVQYPCAHPALRRCDCNGNSACSSCGLEYIETLEGCMNVSPGDWIITGVQGEHYPCKPDIFAATYEDASKRPLSLGVVLGLGEYIIQHTAPDEPAQIVFSEATQEDRETRTVGDLKENEPAPFDHSRIRGQIQFASAAGLDALEVQLRELRKVHWPDTIVPAAPTPPASAQDDAKDERQAFEAWAKKKKMPLARIGEQYDDFWVDHAWNGWQARAALAASQQQEG